MNTDIFIGLILPFAGTSLGAALVFFSKNQINGLLQKTLLGFASGVMMAASVWSLLIPSMEMAQDSGMGRLSFLPAVIGFSREEKFLYKKIIVTIDITTRRCYISAIR